MLKNPTPLQLALFAAVIITLANLAIIALLAAFGVLDIDGFAVFIIVAVTMLATYSTITLVLQKYIYRKIKLIYKSIHRLKVKSSEKNKNVDLSSHIIDEVEREVVSWAKNQNQEIEQLKNLEEYRRNFMGNISHELKTPIFNIQGYLHTLLDSDLEDKEINLHYIQRAASNVERLHNIVQDLEAISRLESGELQLDRQAFDIKELAQEVFEDMEIKARVRGIKLLFKEGAARAYRVRADRENIRQVLVNLISNSIKYGKNEGRTQVGFYDMDRYLLIEVADDGIGISPEHLTRVFERFYRVDKSRSRSQGGTGLGLSIVKHIIEAHKQTINVRSAEGVGSTFGFTLDKA